MGNKMNNAPPIPDNSARVASPEVGDGDKQQEEFFNLLLSEVVFDYQQTGKQSDIVKDAISFVVDMLSNDIKDLVHLSLVNPPEAGCDLNLSAEVYLRQYVVQHTDKLLTYFKDDS